MFEQRTIEMLIEMDKYLGMDIKLYNEEFLPKYHSFRAECLEKMTEEEFATMWNNCNKALKNCK